MVWPGAQSCLLGRGEVVVKLGALHIRTRHDLFNCELVPSRTEKREHAPAHSRFTQSCIRTLFGRELEPEYYLKLIDFSISHATFLFHTELRRVPTALWFPRSSPRSTEG